MAEANGNGVERRARAAVMQWLGGWALALIAAMAAWTVKGQVELQTMAASTKVELGAAKEQLRALAGKVDALAVAVEEAGRAQERRDTAQDYRIERVEDACCQRAYR